METNKEQEEKKTERIDFEEETKKDRWQRCMDTCSEKLHHLNTEMISFILLLIGILLLFTETLSYFGGSVIGLITGCYFSEPIISSLKRLRDSFSEISFARKIVFGVFILALLLKIPTMLLGAAVSAGICQLLTATD